MSIASVGATPPVATSVTETREGPGPDKAHDHDGDDAPVAPVQAAPVPGTGLAVDKTA